MVCVAKLTAVCGSTVCKTYQIHMPLAWMHVDSQVQSKCGT